MILFTHNLCAQVDEGKTEIPKTLTAEDKIRNFLRDSIFQSLGIVSGVVVSEKYNTGMGFGGNVSQTLLDPGLKLKTTAYFWGASKDSNDVSVIGIEESILLEKSPRPDIDFYSGITAGYYTLETDVFHPNAAVPYAEDVNENRIDLFLTSGFRYRTSKNRSVTLTLNYTITHESNEVHIVFGLEFYKPLHSVATDLD